MRISKLTPYILYVITFSLFFASSNTLSDALLMAHTTTGTAYTALIFNFSYLASQIGLCAVWTMPYVICQVAAAALTVKALSLRKLFCLSCVFTVLCHLLCALAFRMFERAVLVFVVGITISGPIPFVLPVLILALAKRSRAVTEAAAGDAYEAILVTGKAVISTDREPAPIRINLCRRYWYALDIILLGLVFLYGALLDHFGLISYIDGLYNWAFSFLAVFGLVSLFVPALLCLLAVVLRMLSSWPKHIQNKRTLLLLRVLVIVCLILYLGLPFTGIRPPGYETFTSGFKKYVEAKADIEVIRAWLSTLGPRDCTEEYIDLYEEGGGIGNSKWPDTIAWPESITRFDPHYVQLSLDDTGHPMIRLTWGGALGHWGFVVGSEGMETPASHLSRWGEYRLELCRGVYVWHEIQ
jgi:hypothetical protein